MNARIIRYAILATLLLALAFVSSSSLAVPSASAAPALASERFIVQASSAANYDVVRANIVRGGGRILGDLRPVDLMVASLPTGVRSTQVLLESGAVSYGRDGLRKLVRPEMQADLFGKPFSATPQQTRIQLDASKIQGPSLPSSTIVSGDPAFGIGFLLWNVDRIQARNEWNSIYGPNTGIKTVHVGVADTGLDYTHSELKGQVSDVVDLTYLEEPWPICKVLFGTGVGDADLATGYGVASDLDFNGHGTWIGGNIAAAMDGVGINGIAPNVKLVSLKISQWCGSAFDSEILAAFVKGADMGLDVISISFGGYSDRTDPLQNAIWNQYVRVVNYARTKGTLIVAAAGNDHVRISAQGQVISHGILTAPGSSAAYDYYGLYETPAGVPGVLMVSATGNVVEKASTTCPPESTGGPYPTCKPTTDKHQPIAAGKQNQLSYYSNYGPRINFAAPGGARKFNLPAWDRGGTPGFPDTFEGQGGVDAWETFSITSNYAQEIPCYWADPSYGSPVLYDKQCYSTIQGTSMATPHVSAAAALVVSARPDVRYVPDAIVVLLKKAAQKNMINLTPGLSSTDYTKGDLSGYKCLTGYCHLGGLPIIFSEAYGKGLINAYGANLY